MDIKTRYNIGDRVRVKADKLVTIPCPFCQGQFKRNVNGLTLYCQNCNEGQLTSVAKNSLRTVDGKITGIRVCIDPTWGTHMEFIDEASYKDMKKLDPDFDRDDSLVEYFVDVPKGYQGKGTYDGDEIEAG